jgi:hypothetical protein
MYVCVYLIYKRCGERADEFMLGYAHSRPEVLEPVRVVVLQSNSCNVIE